MIGERLKHAFAGNDAWILSYRDECFDQIGLKPSVKIELYNGALECQFRKYQLFDGKYKAFRQENDGKEFKPHRDNVRPPRRSSGERPERDKQRFDNERKFEGKRRFDGERKFERKRPEDGKRFEGKREDRRFDGKKDFFGRNPQQPIKSSEKYNRKP